jgi:hypothetical protein
MKDPEIQREQNQNEQNESNPNPKHGEDLYAPGVDSERYKSEAIIDPLYVTASSAALSRG